MVIKEQQGAGGDRALPCLDATDYAHALPRAHTCPVPGFMPHMQRPHLPSVWHSIAARTAWCTISPRVANVCNVLIIFPIAHESTITRPLRAARN